MAIANNEGPPAFTPMDVEAYIAKMHAALAADEAVQQRVDGMIREAVEVTVATLRLQAWSEKNIDRDISMWRQDLVISLMRIWTVRLRSNPAKTQGRVAMGHAPMLATAITDALKEWDDGN